MFFRPLKKQNNPAHHPTYETKVLLFFAKQAIIITFAKQYYP
jgi:hypothetical protein